jgi:4-carboxymuconolactone decarboxylase
MSTTPDPAELPLRPLAEDAWPEKLWRLRSTFAARLNVYRVMAHHPDLLLAWEQFRNHVVRENALGPQLSEVVILRTGHKWASTYEWSHHVVRARARGLTDRRIDSLRGSLDGMDPGDAVLARAVDELLGIGKLSTETAVDLERLVGKDGLLDTIATVGMYSTLAFIANTFDIPVDDDVAVEPESR